MALVYDDPYNLALPDEYRTSFGFLLKGHDEKILEIFKDKLKYEWT